MNAAALIPAITSAGTLVFVALVFWVTPAIKEVSQEVRKLHVSFLEGRVVDAKVKLAELKEALDEEEED